MTTPSLKQLAETLRAIQSDSTLRMAFIEILKAEPETQHERLARLQDSLREQQAPEEIVSFVELLQNEQLAQQILKELESR